MAASALRRRNSLNRFWYLDKFKSPLLFLASGTPPYIIDVNISRYGGLDGLAGPARTLPSRKLLCRGSVGAKLYFQVTSRIKLMGDGVLCQIAQEHFALVKVSGCSTQYNGMAPFIILAEVVGMIEGRDNFGRYFEDLVVGQVYKHRPEMFIFYDRDMNG